MNLHLNEWFPRGNFSPAGRSPTFLFLHGMGGTGSIWRPIAAQLEDVYYCVAPDQRGHGQSRPVPTAEKNLWRATDYAQDLKQLFEERDWRDVTVIGHSMGARTSLALGHLFLSDPGRLRQVVCVDIGLKGAWGGGMGRPLADFLENLPREFADRKTMRDYLFAHCPDPAIAQYLSAVAKNLAPAGAAERWGFPFDHEDVVATIHQANAGQQDSIPVWTMELVGAGVPVTYLRGETSRVWSKEDYEAQRNQYRHPLLQFQEWENCGHGLPFEQRARFVEFVKSLAPGAVA